MLYNRKLCQFILLFRDHKACGIGSQCSVADIMKIIKYEILREKLETTPRRMVSEFGGDGVNVPCRDVPVTWKY